MYLAISGDNVINSLGIDLSHQSQNILSNYFFQICLWLGWAWFIERFIMLFLWKNQDSVHKLVKIIVTAIIFFIAILGIVNIVFEQSVTGILIGAAIITFMLAFILQSLLQDIVTSLAIRHSYQVDDWIMLKHDHIEGCIVKFSWRTLLIKTRDGSQLLIPNRRLGEHIVINYKKHDLPRRQSITITLDFPTERIFRTLLAGTKAVLGKNNLLEEPGPKIMLSDATSSGMKYLIYYWINGNAEPEFARHLILKSVIEHLQIAGLFITSSHQATQSSLESRVKLLAQIPLFSALEQDELNHFAMHLQERLYQEGNSIVKQGAAGQTMFIVAEGLLYIFTELEKKENKVKVGQIISGQFFGEMSLLTGQARSATVIAATDTIVYEVSKDNISPLLSNNKKFSETISKIVADRRLSTLQTLATSAQVEKGAKNEDIAKQILDKMRVSFKSSFLSDLQQK